MGGQIYEQTTVVGATHDKPSTVKNKARESRSRVITSLQLLITLLMTSRALTLLVCMRRSRMSLLRVRRKLPRRDVHQCGTTELVHCEPSPSMEQPAVLIGGEGHKTGQGLCTHQYYEHLQKFGEDTFGLKAIMYRWSAQDVFTLDKMPYIGRQFADAPHLLMATGYRKWGMTNSVVAAHLNTQTHSW